MSFLISFVNHAGSCFLIVTSLFGIVASAALKIVFEMSVVILSISSVEKMDSCKLCSYAGVGPPLLDQVRYHCPVIGILNAPKPVSKSFKRKIWLYNQGKCIPISRFI
jgi:hypothetical protein